MRAIIASPWFETLALSSLQVTLSFADISAIHGTPLLGTCGSMPSLCAFTFSFGAAAAVLAGWFTTLLGACLTREHSEALAPPVSMITYTLLRATTVVGAHRLVACVTTKVATTDTFPGCLIAPSAIYCVAGRLASSKFAVTAFEAFKTFANTLGQVAFTSVGRSIAVRLALFAFASKPVPVLLTLTLHAGEVTLAVARALWCTRFSATSLAFTACDAFAFATFGVTLAKTLLVATVIWTHFVLACFPIVARRANARTKFQVALSMTRALGNTLPTHTVFSNSSRETNTLRIGHVAFTLLETTALRITRAFCGLLPDFLKKFLLFLVADGASIHPLSELCTDIAVLDLGYFPLLLLGSHGVLPRCLASV